MKYEMFMLERWEMIVNKEWNLSAIKTALSEWVHLAPTHEKENERSRLTSAAFYAFTTAMRMKIRATATMRKTGRIPSSNDKDNYMGNDLDAAVAPIL